MSVRGGNPPQPLYAVGPDGKLKPLVCTEDGNLAVFSAHVSQCAGAHCSSEAHGASRDCAAAEPRSKSIRKASSSKLQAVQQVWPQGSGGDWKTVCLVESQFTVLDGPVTLHSVDFRNNQSLECVVKLYDCTLQELETPLSARRKSVRKSKPQKDSDSLDEDTFERCLPAATGDSEHGVFSWTLGPMEQKSFQFPAGVCVRHGLVARASGDGSVPVNGNALMCLSYSR